MTTFGAGATFANEAAKKLHYGTYEVKLRQPVAFAKLGNGGNNKGHGCRAGVLTG